jgi:hypothetical protein
MPEFAGRPGTKLQAGATFAAGVQPAELGNSDNLAWVAQGVARDNPCSGKDGSRLMLILKIAR